MSLKSFLSFSTGELDPVLFDRVTLEKFGKGLETARNIIIGKTGSILSRFSRAHFIKAKNNNETIKVYSPPNSGILTEWGNLYVRVYDFSGSLIGEVAHALLEADLPNMHFVSSGTDIYVFVLGEITLKLVNITTTPVFSGAPFIINPAPNSVVITPAGAPTGYSVDYAMTYVYDGDESLPLEVVGTTYKKPLAAGQSNTLVIQFVFPSTFIDYVSEFRIYRRPNGGGAYGLIGSTSNIYDNAGNIAADFIDLGGDADFTNGIPGFITKNGLGGIAVADIKSKTGVIYQQRLLISSEINEEAILASRPGHHNNFQRDFPISSISALQFKSGTSGNAKILRMIENDGLIVFTSTGVFTSRGALGPNNLALEKKGEWVIDESIAPLNTPGGVFFVDKKTNGISQLVYHESNLSYQTLDHSIFSNHLFNERTLESWAFQDGVVPLINVTFSDGTFASFTYHFEHKMRAWTRHDSVYPVEQVEGTGLADATFFVTNKDGQRYIEVSLPRRIPVATFATNPESDKLNLNSLMDAVKTTQNLLNDSLGGVDEFILTPITPNDWEAPLTLTCGTSTLFPDPGLGDIGTVFRHFDVNDKSAVDLVVTARASDNSVTVEPSAEFPSDQATGFRMYETFNVVTGLDHLDGESVGLFVDGYVFASPYNDAENYPIVTVAGGSLTLPNGLRGAIIVAGRPVVADIGTLNISTVEQSPTTVESININKLYLRVFETRGLFISNKFPEEADGDKDGTSVAGMEDLDEYYVPPGDIIANRYKKPTTKRFEISIPGSWENQGKMCFRQVDPLHFEILSIIPDMTVSRRRSN